MIRCSGTVGGFRTHLPQPPLLLIAPLLKAPLPSDFCIATRRGGGGGLFGSEGHDLRVDARCGGFHPSEGITPPQADGGGAFEEPQYVPGAVEGGTPVRDHQAAVRFYQGTLPRVVEEHSSFDRGLCFEQLGDGEAGAVETKTAGIAGYVCLKYGKGKEKPAFFPYRVADFGKFDHSSLPKSWICKVTVQKHD